MIFYAVQCDQIAAGQERTRVPPHGCGGHAGDLSKPNLGLTLEVYKELAFNLDTVVHNGALVNHAFTYEQLFEPNVLGSLEVGPPLGDRRIILAQNDPACPFMQILQMTTFG